MSLLSLVLDLRTFGVRNEGGMCAVRDIARLSESVAARDLGICAVIVPQRALAPPFVIHKAPPGAHAL